MGLVKTARPSFLKKRSKKLLEHERNALRVACRLMVDKITTVPKTKVGARVGRLDDKDSLQLNHAVLMFLGLAVSPRNRPAA
jgi:mRNA interferase MazF